MKKILSLFLLIFVYYLNFAYGSQNDGPKNLLVSKNMKIISMTDEQGAPLKAGMIVSQTLKNKNQLIFCDYSKIYLMDITTGKTKILNKPENIDAWFPTGVKWCADNQHLYIANYHGKDVLILKFNDQNQLILVNRITDEELVGPENIDVIDKGRVFVVADYDNNKIMLFNEAGKLWSRKVGHAHGVSFSKDKKFIYVSGLQEALIYKFDLQGNVIKKIGEFGWGENGFLWPTSIALTNKNVIISDAHTGKITFLDEDLNFQKSIGGNGLGLTLFNMPYGVSIASDDLLFISDTFKNRILKIDPKKNKIVTIYQTDTFSEINKNLIINQSNEETTWVSNSSQPLGLQYKGRINLSQKVNIKFNEFELNPSWHPGYNSFHYNSQTLIFNSPNNFFTYCFYYWMLAENFEYKNQSFTILGSPQSYNWLLIYKGIIYPINIALDFWIQDNSLVSTRGQIVPLETLAAISAEKIETYINSLQKGADPLTAISELLEIPDFRTKLPSFFVTEKGKEFAENLLNANTIKDQQKIAKLFLKDVEKDTNLYFCEIAIASMVVYGFVEK